MDNITQKNRTQNIPCTVLILYIIFLLCPLNGNNIFRDQFAGMRQAVDIIGLNDEYLRYAAKKETK